MDYVDEQCEKYIDAIFWYNRASDATVKDLSILGSTTGTILSLSGGSTVGLGVLAASFGLATTTVANTSSALLYKMDPASVRSVVEGSRNAYRAALTQDDRPPKLRRKPAATATIRNYLALCLPAGIEKQITKTLSTQSFAETPTSSEKKSAIPLIGPSGSTIGTGSITPELQNRLSILESRLRSQDVTKPPPVTPPAPALGGARNDIERAITLQDMTKIRTGLCLPAADGFDAPLRAAIAEYRLGRAMVPPQADDLKKPLTFSEGRALSRQKSCLAAGHLTPFEQGRFGRPGDGRTQEEDFLREITGDPNVTLANGFLTASHREAIRTKRLALGLPPGEGIDSQLWTLVMNPSGTQ
ncbi:hypothetical protein TSH100_04865 [Azospirillum sp. TSH100]|nr:hypothetical protein TSH100_04865 [Azospirillum sp. TSH100]